MKDVSQLPFDERLQRDPQFAAEWEAALVETHNPRRSSEDHDFHDELWLRAEITRAGDRKTADMLMAASREIARLEAENQVLRDRVEVAVAALARHRPLPEIEKNTDGSRETHTPEVGAIKSLTERDDSTSEGGGE